MPTILLPIPHQRQREEADCLPACAAMILTYDHALVVVGFDEQRIFVNDPAFDNHPIAIPLIQFELAWMAFDYRYGCLQEG